jgi:hypothetical protein
VLEDGSGSTRRHLDQGIATQTVTEKPAEYWHVKILLLNQDWFATELRALGHQVRVCGSATHLDTVVPNRLFYLDQLLSEHLAGFKPDIIVWLDNSAPLMVLGLEDSEIPVVYYSVDAHHHYEMHARLVAAFDHALVAQRDYLNFFEKSGTPSTWFPLWAPRYVEASCEKRYELTFVGTMNRALNPERVDFFERLARIRPIHLAHGNYWEIFPNAEIVVIQTVKGYLNFRVFEALMCGAALLTERTPNGLLELFTDGHHLVTYDRADAHGAAQRAQELLANPARMREIAAAGRAEVLAKHTASARAIQLEALLTNVRKRPRSPARHLAMMLNFTFVSSLTEHDAPLHSTTAICAALQSANAALREGAAIGNLEAIQLVRACCAYDRLVQGSTGADLLREFSAAHPHHPLLTVAQLRSSLNRGDLGEAHRLAACISPQPAQRVFELAEELITVMLRTP